MSTLKTYYPTLKFIGKFVLIYVILVAVYNFYLSFFQNQTDIITYWTGKLVTGIYHILGTDAQSMPIESEPGMKLILNGQYVARIVEGCTSISVIIMFIAFILSFGKNLKRTLVFALTGSVLIFIFNLFRIVFIGYILYAFPQYQDITHRVIFPALIYGFVIVLWLYFIIKYND